MDTRIIEVRKNIAIPLVLTPGTGRYTYTINTVDFIPDEMVVKEIVYSSNKDTEIGVVSLIYTDIISDVTGSFYIYARSTPANLIYTIRKPIRGEYSCDEGTRWRCGRCKRWSTSHSLRICKIPYRFT